MAAMQPASSNGSQAQKSRLRTSKRYFSGGVEDEGGKLAVAFDVSDIVLTTLDAAAQFAPIPYLKDAAGLAVGIFQMVQDTKGNQESFRRLAADACGLVYAAVSIWKEQERDGKPLSPDLVKHLGELLDTITRVHKFAQEHISRNRVLRFITNRSDASKIQDYQAELKHALDRFGMQSHITIREAVSRIQDQQQAILTSMEEHGNLMDVPARNATGESPSSTANFEPSSEPASPISTPSTPPDDLPSSLRPTHFSAFGSIVANGDSKFTSIAGDYVIHNNHSTTNSHNSGNVTNISTINSGNDYSKRTGRSFGGYRRRGRTRETHYYT